MSGTSLAQRVMPLFGAFYVLIGVIGFFDHRLRQLPPEHGRRADSGLSVNPFHNLVHLAIGAFLIIMSRQATATAEGACLGVGTLLRRGLRHRRGRREQPHDHQHVRPRRPREPQSPRQRRPAARYRPRVFGRHRCGVQAHGDSRLRTAATPAPSASTAGARRSCGRRGDGGAPRGAPPPVADRHTVCVADRLKDYRRKRDAEATPEPSGEPGTRRRPKRRPRGGVTSFRSTTRRACTGTCASSTTASPSRGRSPTGSPRTRRTTASRLPWGKGSSTGSASRAAAAPPTPRRCR